MNPLNTLFILSDEHDPRISGCYGHPLVQTPNIDALANRGTLFENAYTNSPICIPSRSALQTGHYVHQTGNWCNGNPYTGSTPGWGHHLKATGHEVVSVGKLHFRSTDDDNGFTEEILPLHVVDGIGDLYGCLRKERPRRDCQHTMAQDIGPGGSTYQDYDRAIAEAACDWLKKKANESDDKPWTLFVSLVCPHFPLIAPEEFYRLYDPDDMPLPKLYGDPNRVNHPALKQMQEYLNYDDLFDEEKVRIATASYYALVSFIDHLIGDILGVLKDTGQEDSTRVIYTSDHGESLGSRGFWGKSTMYEESVSIPFIVSGPDIPSGKRIVTPVSLVDVGPTLIQFNGESLSKSEADKLPGENVMNFIDNEQYDRAVFSEYHAIGSVTGIFMIRMGKWKYVHYIGYPPQLFNLDDDPEELTDLGTNPELESVRLRLHEVLLGICDPDEQNAKAFRDQASRIAEHGGMEAVLNHKTIPYTPAPTIGT